MSSMKNLKPALLSAAIGVMAGYSNVAQAISLENQSISSIELNQEVDKTAAELADLINFCERLEQDYRAMYKRFTTLVTNESTSFLDLSDLDEIAVDIKEVRDLETVFKASEVPAALALRHMDARRSLARTRSWAVSLHELLMQARAPQALVDGAADHNGLRLLADHSTSKLIALAQA